MQLPIWKMLAAKEWDMYIAAFPSAFSTDESNTVWAQKPWPRDWSHCYYHPSVDNMLTSLSANTTARLPEIAPSHSGRWSLQDYYTIPLLALPRITLIILTQFYQHMPLLPRKDIQMQSIHREIRSAEKHSTTWARQTTQYKFTLLCIWSWLKWQIVSDIQCTEMKKRERRKSSKF